MKTNIDFEMYVDFHRTLGWYVGDCYSEETQKMMKKLKVTTYTVQIGNTTVHYFSNEVPKKKDFNLEWNVEARNKDDKFWKELRAYIRSNKHFIKNNEVSKKINVLKRKTI